jgi:hypothetical protein
VEKRSGVSGGVKAFATVEGEKKLKILTTEDTEVHRGNLTYLFCPSSSSVYLSVLCGEEVVSLILAHVLRLP